MEEIKQLKEKAEMLKEQKIVLSNQLEETKISLRRIEDKLENYNKYLELEKERAYKEKILKWISGKADKSLAPEASYSGIVCPDLNLYYYPSNKQPIGSKEEIDKLLKDGGYKMLTFETRFVPSGLWGQNEIFYKLHKNLG